MSSLQDVVRYFVQQYPYADGLSKTRLTQWVFWAAWFSARSRGQQMTPMRWYFDHYGPYGPDVMEITRNDRALRVRKTVSGFGYTKEMGLGGIR